MLRLSSFARQCASLTKLTHFQTSKVSGLIPLFRQSVPFYHLPLSSILVFSFSSFSASSSDKSSIQSPEAQKTDLHEAQDAPENEFRDLLDKHLSKQQQGTLSREDVLKMLIKLAGMTNPHLYSSFTLKYYMQAAKLAEDAGIADAIEVGGVYVWIVTLYLNGEEIRNIMSYIEKGIQIYSNAAKNGNKDAKSGMIHLEFAKGLVCNRKWLLDEAESILEGILKKKGDIPQEEFITLLPQIYENLGDIAVKKKDLEKAAGYFEKAIEAVSQDQEGTEELIIYLNRLICVTVERKDNLKALEYAHKSLDLSLKHYGKNDPRVGVSFNTLAQIYLRRRELDESIKYHEEGMEILEKFPEFAKDRAPQDKLLLATAYFKKENIASAKEMFIQALTDTLEVEGKESLKLAELYHLWGEVLSSSPKTEDEAIGFFKRALEIYSNSKSKDEYINILKSFIKGQIFFFSAKEEKAIECFKEALQLAMSLDQKPKLLEEIYRFLGVAYLETKNFEEAIKCAEKAIQVCKASEGKFLCSNYKNLGLAYEESGLLEKAAEAYQKGLETFPEGFTKHEKKMKNVKLLVDVLKKLGRNEEAEKALKRYG